MQHVGACHEAPFLLNLGHIIRLEEAARLADSAAADHRNGSEGTIPFNPPRQSSVPEIHFQITSRSFTI